MKRIFIGVPVKEALPSNFAQGLRQQDGIRWIKPKNLHVTLVPPWETDDIESIVKQLQAIKVQPFEMVFNEITFGPNPKEPHLIWAAGRASSALLDLKTSIERNLAVMKNSDRILYKLHLTLARFRGGAFAQFSLKHLKEKIHWQLQAASFALYQSHLSPFGADYEILFEFQF